MTIAILAAVGVGFARSFFLRPLFPDWPAPAEPFFYFHGAVFTAWFVLLVAQALLVTARRTSLHRRLGVAGVVIATAMVALGTLGGLVAAARPGGFVGIPVPPLQFLIVPLSDMLMFSIFVGLAVAKRDDPQSHKRLMLLGSICLLTAAVARWPFVHGTGVLVYFLVTDLFLVPLLAWDLASRRRLHPVTRWGGLAIVASQPLKLLLSGTAAWLAFARFATGLVD